MKFNASQVNSIQLIFNFFHQVILLDELGRRQAPPLGLGEGLGRRQAPPAREGEGCRAPGEAVAVGGGALWLLCVLDFRVPNANLQSLKVQTQNNRRE